MQCARCGFINPAGHRYCGQCGAALQQRCSHCGHANHQQARFCNQCGTLLGHVCPRCGALEVPDARFCGTCGFQLEKICPACQTINPLYANYCNHCGHHLPHLEIQPIQTTQAPTVIYRPQPPKARVEERAADVSPPPQPAEPQSPSTAETTATAPQDDERLKRLQEYIPEALRTMILSTKGKIEGERKLVTMVFADLSGYTALSERFADEPEEIARIINECHHIMSDCIYKYEGIVDKIVGDEVVALFGAPISHENDAERAILASLEMIEQVVAYGKRIGLPLNLHIGINTGTVVVGDIGTEGRLMNYTAIGDPMNVAARLEKVAEAGEIAVGEETYRLTRRLFEWPDEPIYVELKGKTGPQPVYKVKGRKAHREDVRGLDGMQSQMIGRDEEFQALMDCFAKVEQGEGQIGVIMGEAGMGKSRLKREFKQAIQDRAIWIEGQCLSHTPKDAKAYSVFVDAFQNHFGILSTDTEDIAREKLASGVRQLFEGSQVDVDRDILPFLFRILSLPLSETMAQAIQYLEQDPENFRHRTFSAIHDLIEKVAESQPLVFALEDLHWVDELSIDLILFLMRTLLDARVLLLCVYRPERTDRCWQIGETARATFQDVYTEIAIGRLKDEHMSMIFHALLNLEDTEENRALEELVLEKVQGNPFYMEEMIRSLLDDGVLQRAEDGGHHVLTQPVDDIEVPPGVEAILRTRIDRLDALQMGSKRTLQHASVIGRVFERRVLEGISDMPEALDAHFNTLMQLELIDPVTFAPEPEYQFQHLLTYQIAYESLTYHRRRELHAKVGAVLERLYPIDRYPSKLSEIASHYRRSSEHTKAIRYLLKSGQYEQSLVNCARAYDCYAEVLRRLALDPEDLPDEERREAYAIAYEGLGDICCILGKYRRAEEDAEDDHNAEESYLAALEYRTDVHAKARIYNSLGHVYERLSAWDKAQEQYERGLELLGDEDSPQKPRLYMGLGWVYFRRGRYQEAMQEYRKASRLLDKSTDYVALSELYKNFAIIHLQSGNAEEAFEWMERSIDMAHKTNDELLVAKLYNTRAEIWRTSKSVDAAIESIQQALAIREKYGELDGIAHSKVALGNAYRQKNELEQAVQCFEEAIAVAQKVGNIRLVGDSYNSLGLVAMQTGNLDRAIHYLQESLKIQRELDRPRGVAVCLVNLADVFRKQGNFDQAERHLKQAIQQAETIGNQQVAAYAYLTMAEMANDQEHWKKALTYCDTALPLAKGIGDRRLLGDVSKEMARAHIGLKDRRRARELLEEAHTLYATLGDQTKLEEIEHLIEEVASGE